MDCTNRMAFGADTGRTAEVRPKQLEGTIDEVEQHAPDVIGGSMSSNEDTWKDVGNNFAALGRRFKEHYRETEDAPSSEEVKAGFETIVDGVERVFSSLGRTIRDESVRDDAKKAGNSLINAISGVIEDLSTEAKGMMRHRPSDEDGAEADPITEAKAAADEANDAVDRLRDDLTSEE